ncbi:MAG: FAD-binding oxidoreductase [Alphaproteobacteria bacterium]|nr:FAD-binding oxidoreductase [Alphaproteobacteria bacterium]
MPDPLIAHSYYAATVNQQLGFPVLNQDLNIEVCIIGGGYSGLNTAIELQKKGIESVIVEAENVAFGASGRNGGQVHAGLRLGATDLIKMFGLEQAGKFWALSMEAKDILNERLQEYNIKCDYRSGLLNVAAKKSHVSWLAEEVESAQKAFGYQHAQFLTREQVRDFVDSKVYWGGVIDHAAGHLHPLNYALGLAQICQHMGIKIFEKSRVIAVDKNSKGYLVRTNGGNIQAKIIVMCCNAYLNGLQPKLAARIMPIANFMLATQPLEAKIAQQLIKDNLAVCDTKFVVNYYRLSSDYRLIYGGGEAYTNTPPADIKKFVRPFMLKTFPQLADVRIDYAWGGKLAVTTSRLPDLGKLAPGFYYTHGYSGQGVSMTALAGRLVAEDITGNHGRFNLMSTMPNRPFPGGTLLRWPIQVAAMSWAALVDRL